MKTENIVAFILALIVMVLTIHACTTDSGQNSTGYTVGDVHAFSVKLPSGKDVVCVTWSSGYPGGLSCDWNHVD